MIFTLCMFKMLLDFISKINKIMKVENETLLIPVTDDAIY